MRFLELSLREAIIDSNATPGPNTIIVPAGTYKLTIPGAGETAGETGDLDVSNSVTIEGAGAGSTIIDANDLDRVFYVFGPGSTFPDVTISGVTIEGGLTPDSTSFGPSNGGGIEVYNVSLTVDQCVIQNNRTGNGNSYGGRGGGIEVRYGTLTITNSTITGNSTGNGASTPTSPDTATFGGFGGGIAIEESSATINNCVISDNRTGEGSTGTTPGADFDGGRGGGIYTEGGPTADVSISNSTITGNISGDSTTPAQGGGIENTTYGILSLDNSTISNNTATLFAGGIDNSDTIDHITNCTIAANVGQGDGFSKGAGGIYNNGTITLISGTTISGNEGIVGDVSVFQGGGGIDNDGQIGTIVNSTISGNSTNDEGGGILDAAGDISQILNTTIADNTAAVEGGGLFLATYANLIPVIGALTNTIIANNVAGTANDFEELGQVNSATYDLMQDPTGNNFTDGTNGNIVGHDPLLGALTNNGGPTETMSLLYGSPAIGAGTNVGAPSTDQRGLPRPDPGDNEIDIGAIEVQGVADHPPVASNQSVSTNEDTALNGRVSATDADGDPLTYSVVAVPSDGNLAFHSDGSFTYTPATAYSGSDSFTFRAFDGQAYSNIATVSITVNAIQPPVANPDSYSTSENTVLSAKAPGVLDNDTDPNNLPLTAVLYSSPSHGTLTLNSDGSFTYTPATGFLGTDSFAYEASDGQLDSNVATVTITVGQAPVAVNDAYAVDEDSSLAAGAGATHVMMYSQPGDFIGQGLTYDFTPADSTITAKTLPYDGVEIDVSASGESWTLDFAAPNHAPLAPGIYTGAMRWPFEAAGDPGLNVSGDSRGANTLTGQFTVTQVIFDSSGANVLSFDASFVQYIDGSSAALIGQVAFHTTIPQVNGVLANDNDLDPGTTLSATQVNGPSHGTLALNPDGSFFYIPDSGFVGTDSFTYRDSDGYFSSNVATVTLNVAAPVAKNDSYTTGENTPLTVAAPGVLGNDTDPAKQALTAAVVAGPTHGSLALNGDGSFTYTPATGYTGTDSFTYQDNDGTATSNTATVTITVAIPTGHAAFVKADTTTLGN
jgi:hypothetical protein